jgi:riboflavin kinase
MTLTLRGRLVGGLGEAAGFTSIPWVREAFLDRLGIDVYPGTVNLEVDASELTDWMAIKATPGIAIPPGQPGFCDATAWHVQINSMASGASILPHVEDYPTSKLEVIASQSLREKLGISEGDVVTIALQASDA